MLRKFIQFLFRKPILFITSKMHGAPKEKKVYQRLSTLLNNIQQKEETSGITLNITDTDKIIIISDLHKGSGNAADDFVQAAPVYIDAMYYYLQNGYTLIALGDIEELWENNIVQILAEHEHTVHAEKEFVQYNRFYKVVGNHDLYWKNNIIEGNYWLKKMYGTEIPIYDGLLLQYADKQTKVDFFLTHGHQGDATSDGNKFSKWFVANVWSRVQAYLEINLNVPSKDYLLRDKHNKMMYNWSVAQPNTVLVTGHTHKPVFASLNHLQRLKKELAIATQMEDFNKVKIIEKELYKRKQEYVLNEPYLLKKPSYFNSGCGCYQDGDITLIEIAGGNISLVKWYKKNVIDFEVLESMSIQQIVKECTE
jgi:UDP-2,3-diacylglucosamine pyrophosphatase LpxH